ncbi:unnamed protein product [Paramecium primaurelia]|uniref:Uncharacterized protein n=1 Tax=Paramecium primaurelia TaxID=5886 RepID=A0A8S1MSX0_PARPR|nr:unnamed protein product [Paramecium primaurelia]
MNSEIIEVCQHQKDNILVKMKNGEKKWYKFDEVLKQQPKMLAQWLEKQVFFREVEEDKLY